MNPIRILKGVYVVARETLRGALDDARQSSSSRHVLSSAPASGSAFVTSTAGGAAAATGSTFSFVSLDSAARPAAPPRTPRPDDSAMCGGSPRGSSDRASIASGPVVSGVASAGTTASLPRVLPPTEAPGPLSGCHGRVRALPPPSAAAARLALARARGELGRLLLAGPRLVLRELGARGDELGRLLLRLVLAVAVGQAQIRQRPLALLGERLALGARSLAQVGQVLVVAALLRRLLLLERLPGRLLRVEPARRPRLRTAPLEREHGPVVQVRQRRDGGDHALAVLAQLRHHRVALHVQAGELRHGSEQTHHRLWVAVDLVILQVHGGQGRARAELLQALQRLELAVAGLQGLQLDQPRDVSEMRHVVVGDVQRAERDGQRRRDARDHVLLREQAPQLDARAQALQVL